MDNILIEVKSKPDYKSFRNFARFALFKGKGYRVGPIILFILSTTLIILTLILSILTQGILVIVLCSFSVAILFLFLYLYLLMPRISYKKSQPLLADEIFYRFYEDRLEAEGAGENVKGAESYRYSVFKNIYEVKSAFYLMAANGVTVIIPKQYLDAVQIEYLSGFFKNCFGNKYKKCF